MARNAVVALCLLLLPSCTLIEIHGAGPTHTTARLGVLKLVPEDGARAVFYRSRGLGVVPGLNGATLGYAREDVAAVYARSECRIVIFELPDDVAANTFWQDLITQNRDVCYIGEEGHELAAN
jgi:hypothetical protein